MKPKSDRIRLQQSSEEIRPAEPQTIGREFASVEDLLRYDAAQVAPPASIATRLEDSLAGPSQPKRPWWRRLFPK